MKTYGDIPAHDRDLILQLEALETWFYEHGKELPSLSIAKGFSCIAHDYYSIFMDEEGERLLKFADKRCPGYFETAIHYHVAKDKEFAILVENLKKTSALKLMESLGYEDESV